MRDYFYCLVFPHPRNNHRAKVLHFRTFFLIISLFIISAFLFSSDVNPFASKIRAFADISTQELLKFTNEKRAEYGLSPLMENAQLQQAAYSKADDMFAKDYWAHDSPDGLTPWIFIKGAGYDYVYAGENLAKGFINSEDIVNAWMASPDHRENLLSENFKEVGFAVKSGELKGEQTFLVVQEFGNKTVVPAERIGGTFPPKEENVLSLNLSAVTPRPSNAISYEFVLIIIFSIITVLTIDMIYIKRKKVVRFVGHNADHIFFLLVIVIVITFLGSGHVL